MRVDAFVRVYKSFVANRTYSCNNIVIKILPVDDDGLYAKGLLTLAERLSKDHSVTIVAPDNERSGSGRSLTFHSALNYVQMAISEEYESYILNGTPADCTKFGIDTVLKGEKPDVVISGINNTCNIGTDIAYSGTVNAAIEACMHDVYGIAVSYDCDDSDYTYVADFVARNLEFLIGLLPTDKNTVFNINFPCVPPRLKGVRFSTTGNRKYHDEYQFVEGKGYFITGYPVGDDDNEENTDVVLNGRGYATVSPVRLNFNDDELYRAVKELKL